MPVLHVIAGPNGAGKSAYYEYVLQARYPSLPFVPSQDADERERLLQARESFVTETVMSHPSRLALLTHARTLGYQVVLHALAVDDPRVLLQRVAQRVREGGAPVPSHKVLQRYPRSLANLRRAVPLADLSFLVDSAEAYQGGPRLIASCAGGRFKLHTVLRPRWVDKVLGFAEG